jgi:hypothetical protein
MKSPPPSTVRVVSHEPITEHKVRILLEVIVDVHRLAEVSSGFLKTAVAQVTSSRPRQKR